MMACCQTTTYFCDLCGTEASTKGAIPTGWKRITISNGKRREVCPTCIRALLTEDAQAQHGRGCQACNPHAD